MSKNVKTVRITESELVTLIDKIATEAIVEEKKVWLAEQKEANNKLVENKLADLEKKVAALTEAKK